ncbi:CheW-like domain protein [Tsuneonella dongtanensis]|uniref:CheW-like domain protein n=1 Tax=Tsuneonella dongtanensis TaxID=692370 RepID=A0A1B2ABJ4_9SPHN|nr:chemotaxis protein CheW [Tsuneonella dongtanensis]ANY19471.1 CheW-like domain protein [Tsuneonella dongtanensis]
MTDLVLVFALGGRRAALPTDVLHSVVELDAVCPIPRAPEFVLGLSALRSHTLTVVDAAAALGIAAPRAAVEGSRAAIVDFEGHRYALVVDSIDDVAERLSEPTPVPGETGPGWQRASEGLIETARGPAMLLSLGALIAGPGAMAA